MESKRSSRVGVSRSGLCGRAVGRRQHALSTPTCTNARASSALLSALTPSELVLSTSSSRTLPRPRSRKFNNYINTHTYAYNYSQPRPHPCTHSFNYPSPCTYTHMRPYLYPNLTPTTTPSPKLYSSPQTNTLTDCACTHQLTSSAPSAVLQLSRVLSSLLPDGVCLRY